MVLGIRVRSRWTIHGHAVVTAQATVYTQSGCRLCARMIDKLESAGIGVEVVNLEDPASSGARTYVMEVLGAKSVPVTVVWDPPGDESVIFGYNPDAINCIISRFTTNDNDERNA